MEPVSKYYTSQGLRLHYTDWGNKTKPLLILIHGGMDHARSWDFTARKLRYDFHVIAPDLRGHGDSAWAPGSMYSVLDSVLDTFTLIELLEAPQVYLIGHSYGAMVSYLYTGLYPQRIKKLILIEGMSPARFNTDEPIWKRIDRWVTAVKKTENRPRRHFDSLAVAESKLRRLIPALSDEQIRHLTCHGVSRNDDGSYCWKYDERAKIVSPIRYAQSEMDALQKRILCPVLFLYGANGWAKNPFEQNGNSRPRNIKSTKIAGAGHWLHHECFDAFIDCVASFLGNSEQV